jgi:hypothetical protein
VTGVTAILSRREKGKSRYRVYAVSRLQRWSRSPMFTGGAPCGLTFSHSARTIRPTRTRPRSFCKTLYSSAIRLKNDSVQNKLYAKSLLLPRTTFPQWTDPLKTEVLLREKICDDLYRWQVRFQCSVSGPSHACIADIGS